MSELSTLDDAHLPVDVDRRTGRLMSVAELRAALLMVRGGLDRTAADWPLTELPPVPSIREVFAGAPGLPLVTVSGREAVGYVVGSSGGSGESLLADLLTSSDARSAVPEPGRIFLATDHHWPLAGDVVHVVLCARTNLGSLRAAQRAAAQWGTGHLDEIDLVGLVLMADVPGREPKPISDFIQVLVGGVPRHWRIPWIGEWRLSPPDPAGLPHAVSTAVSEILSALSSTPTSNT